jgi:hypothetical protein
MANEPWNPGRRSDLQDQMYENWDYCGNRWDGAIKERLCSGLCAGFWV